MNTRFKIRKDITFSYVYQRDRKYVKGNVLHRLDGPALERHDGTKIWRVNGVLNREDGPACEYSSGRREWWVDGKRHRLDGPAIEWSDVGKEWWVNGRRHRLDGPAVEWGNGGNAWYVDGQYVDVLSVFGHEPSYPLSTDEQMLLRLSI